jgi:hypothetical protein
METSILISTKKILGIAAEYTAFDLDIISHINSAFSVLTQLGVGPTVGFMIEDESSKWQDFVTSTALLNMVKTYVYLKVRVAFDPPTTSYHLTAMKDQIAEHEWRLNEFREETTPWTAPTILI